MSETMNRKFKGVWIPKDVWLDSNLSITKKCLLIEIDSLDNEDGCFASNAHFSKFLGCSIRQVQRYIKSLIEEGYIIAESSQHPTKKNEEIRVLRMSVSVDDFGKKSVPKNEGSSDEEKHEESVATPTTETSLPPRQNSHPPHDESVMPLYKEEEYKGKIQESVSAPSPTAKEIVIQRLRENPSHVKEVWLMMLKINHQELYTYASVFADSWIGKQDVSDRELISRAKRKGSQSFGSMFTSACSWLPDKVQKYKDIQRKSSKSIPANPLRLR